jgi:hypothetical protein
MEGVSAKSKLTISSSVVSDGRDALGRMEPNWGAVLNSAVGDGDLQGSIWVVPSSFAGDESASFMRGFEGRSATPLRSRARAVGVRIAGVGDVLSFVSSSSLTSDSF